MALWFTERTNDIPLKFKYDKGILSFDLPLQTGNRKFNIESTNAVRDLINNIKAEDENIQKIEILWKGKRKLCYSINSCQMVIK